MTFASLLLLGRCFANAYPGPYPPGGSCNVNGPSTLLCIGAPISDNAVLQREPARAAITGSMPAGYGTPPMVVTVTIADEDGHGHGASAVATVRADNTWKALLPPRPAFGNYTLRAQCSTGCHGPNASFAATLRNITFGDVSLPLPAGWAPAIACHCCCAGPLLLSVGLRV